jgi:hypothetical protein
MQSVRIRLLLLSRRWWRSKDIIDYRQSLILAEEKSSTAVNA